MDKIGILGYGNVGQNFYALCQDSGVSVYIYDDFYFDETNKSLIGNSNDELKNCKIIVICSAKKSLRDYFLLKTITLGIKREKVRFYTECFYPSYWLKDSIKSYLTQGLLEHLSKDTPFLTELKKILKFAFDDIVKLERKDSFYDDIYTQEQSKDYTQSPYYEGWQYALNILKDYGLQKVKILDIGCGSGIFAKMLYENNIPSYKGVDFSEEGIKIAQLNTPQWAECFLKEDIFESKVFEQDYSHIILFEVLEHINDDIKILSKIPSKTMIIASVPSFYSEGHIRIFENIDQIRKRYGSLMEFVDFFELQLNQDSKIFYFNAIKK